MVHRVFERPQLAVGAAELRHIVEVVEDEELDPVFLAGLADQVAKDADVGVRVLGEYDRIDRPTEEREVELDLPSVVVQADRRIGSGQQQGPGGAA